MKKPEISLILPCYNESEHILESLERIFSSLKKSKVNSEVIVVEDKSTDNTHKLVKKIINKYKLFPIRIIAHSRNEGRGASVADGIKNARGKIVGFMDVDCEISPKYIKQFIQTAKKTDVVAAKRVYKFNLFSIHRWFISKMYALMIRSIFRLPIRDTEAGFKFFQREKILPVLNSVKDRRWFWDTEIIVRAEISRLTITEIPVIFSKRSDKTSTVRIVSDSIEYLKRLVALWLELNKKRSQTNTHSFWLNEGRSFDQFYKQIKTFSPKNYVKQFLNSRTIYLTELIKNERPGYVLDIGCGSGLHMKLLSTQSQFIEGIDISEEMLDLAKKQLRNVDPRKWKLTLGDAHLLPYEANSFNTVISLGLLDYVDNPSLVLRECHRVLKKNGLLVTSIPKKPSFFSILRTSFGNKIKQVVFNLPPISNIVTKEEFRNLLESSGFKIDTIHSVWTTMWIAKARRN